MKMVQLQHQRYFYKFTCAFIVGSLVLLDSLGRDQRSQFPGALALEPGLPPEHKVPQTQEEIRIHNQKVMKERREKAIRQWKEEKEKSHFRKEKQICDADGFCRPIGVFASFRRGHGLMFCRDCSNSFIHGAFVDTWDCHYGPRSFEISGEVVFAVPNYGEAKLINPVRDTILLVYRGKVPFYTKVLNAQRAGAAAVLIIDDGSCTSDFNCGKWLGSREKGNMAALDTSPEWGNVFIPSALITLEQSKRLVRLLDTKQINFGRERQTFVREPQ